MAGTAKIAGRMLGSFWRRLISSRSTVFFYCLIFFIAGILAGNFLIWPHTAVFSVLLFFVGAAVFFRLGGESETRKQGFILLLFVSCFSFGFWRYEISLPDYGDRNKIYYYSNSTVQFIGKVKEVDNRLNGQKLTITASKLRQDRNYRNISGLVLVNLPLYPQYNYGDRLQITCFLQRPGVIKNFDYGRYLGKSEIYGYCASAEARLEQPSGQSLFKIFFNLKAYLVYSLNAAISEPEVSLLRGILLGDSRGLPAEYVAMFSDLGLTHIIAISGDHIAIITAIFLELLIAIGISRRRAFWPLVFLVFFYVVLVGAAASAVRAAIMALLVIYAQKIGRASHQANALALAAALMIFFNPQILLADVGFQLSFAAVWGLSYLSPPLLVKIRAWPDFFRIKEIFVATLSAQIATWPLLAFYFGKLSLITLLANVLILPVIPFLTVFGLTNLLVAAVCLPLGRILGWVSWLLCAYWIEISELLHQLPFNYLTINNFGWLPFIAYYILLLVLVGWRHLTAVANSVRYY